MKATTKKTLIGLGAYIAWNVILWLVGTSAKVRLTAFEAFAAGAVLNAVFYGGLQLYNTIIAGSKSK